MFPGILLLPIRPDTLYRVQIRGIGGLWDRVLPSLDLQLVKYEPWHSSWRMGALKFWSLMISGIQSCRICPYPWPSKVPTILKSLPCPLNVIPPQNINEGPLPLPLRPRTTYLGWNRLWMGLLTLTLIHRVKLHFNVISKDDMPPITHVFLQMVLSKLEASCFLALG